jgi:predicted glutamine amidotransferase
MCRLLAFASAQTTTIGALLTPDELANYRAMSTLHGDGWGAAVWESAAGIEKVNSVQRAIDDPTFFTVASAPATAGIVHLRWATAGLPVCLENTHPFTSGDWSFAHNGSFPHHERILDELTAERRANLVGTTDSELYFQLILQETERAGDIVPGIRRAVAIIRERCGLGSLNCLLLTPGRLLAVQAVADTPAPVKSLQRSAGDQSLPEGHDEQYYHLRYVVRDGSFVVASTGVAVAGWTTQRDDTIIDVDTANRSATVWSLDDDTVLTTLSYSPSAA